jgi:hypothetical protein
MHARIHYRGKWVRLNDTNETAGSSCAISFVTSWGAVRYERSPRQYPSLWAGTSWTNWAASHVSDPSAHRSRYIKHPVSGPRVM